MKEAVAVRAQRVVMENLRSEEGKTASHFAGESSNIRCGKSETYAYIRRGRAAARARTPAALLQTVSGNTHREGMEINENRTEFCAPDRHSLQCSAKHARATSGAGRKG